MKPRRFDWYPVDWLDGVAALPPDQRGVYDTIINLIYAHASEDGSIDIQEKELALRCCCHWRSLRRILGALVKGGKILMEGTKITIMRCAEEVQKACTRVARVAQKPCRTAAEPPQDDVILAKNNDLEPPRARAATINHQPSTINHQESDRGKPLSSSNPPKGDFDAWWQLYPHKVGKQAAKAKYKIALRRTTPEELVAGVGRYIASKPPDRSWCNPATWLNQGRWEDQPAIVEAKNAQFAIDTRPISIYRGPTAPPPESLLERGCYA